MNSNQGRERDRKLKSRGTGAEEHMTARTQSMEARTLAASGKPSGPPIRNIPPERFDWLKRYNDSLRSTHPEW